MKLLTELKIFVETTKNLVNHASLSALYREDREAMNKLVAQGEQIIKKLEAMDYAAPNLTRAMVEHMSAAQDLRRILDTFDLLPEEPKRSAA